MVNKNSPLDISLLEILKELLQTFSPPPELKISEFADQTRILSPEDSLEYGQWDTSKAEFQREIMDCVLDPRIERVSVMGNNQWGKTQIILNIIKYFIVHDPSPIILMQPTAGMAEDFSKERWSPMVRDNLDLSEKLLHEACTILHKSFYGGNLTLVGSESATQLAARPKRIMIADDIDRCAASAGYEGDPIELLIRRLVTFWNRKIICFSTPTLEATSKIYKLWNQSDQRYYFIQCKHCGEWQWLYWHNKEINRYGVVFERDKDKKLIGGSVYYSCEKCNGKLYNNDINRAVKKGKWMVTRPEIQGHAGFYMNELYSPWVTLTETVQNFLRTKDDPTQNQVWVNTAIADVWRKKGESPDWERLYFRRERYPIGIIPFGGLLLVAGADVQGDRIEVEIVAYGRNKESWSVDYRVFSGKSKEGIPFLMLDELMNEQFKYEAGGSTQIHMLCIDAGHETQAVYNWTRKYTINRVNAVHGRSSIKQIFGGACHVDLNYEGKKFQRGARYFPVGVDVLKTELYNFLKLEFNDKGYPAGYCHFPDYAEEFFKQLTAEELKYINKKYRWELLRERNEALDCRNYARVAASIYGIDRYTENEWKTFEHNSNQVIKISVSDQKKKGYTISKGIKL